MSMKVRYFDIHLDSVGNIDIRELIYRNYV